MLSKFWELKVEKVTAKEVIAHIESLRNDEQRKVLMGFFKTGPGE